jgi:hypothetical protein
MTAPTRMKISLKAVAAAVIAAPLIVVGGAAQAAFFQGFLESGKTTAADTFYADQQSVCEVLDASPTKSTVIDTIYIIQGPAPKQRVSDYTHEVLMGAVTDICPQHYDLVSPFAQTGIPVPE